MIPAGPGREAALSLFADDPDVFLQGTGADEGAQDSPRYAQLERDFAGDAWSWTLSRQSISSAGSCVDRGDLVIRVSMGGRTMDIPIA
jgi:hypothetical protein